MRRIHILLLLLTVFALVGALVNHISLQTKSLFRNVNLRLTSRRTQATFEAGNFHKAFGPSWCQPDDLSGQKGIHGLIYVKVYKAASSTTAGVAIRIADEVGKRFALGGRRCRVRSGHGKAMDRGFPSRNKKKSYLWSMVRDPRKRALSHIFYFRFSRKQKEPTENAVLRALNITTRKGHGGFQTHYLSPYKYEANLSSRNLNLVHKVIDGIIDEYDFLGVVERYDESLVVLRLLLGLEASDVMYLGSKVAGDYSPECSKIVKSFTTDAITEKMNSEEWMSKNIGDFILYEAINRKLDRTIDSIGRDIFDKAMEEHSRLKQLVNEKCADKAVFPCTNGVDTSKEAAASCYRLDAGCGYPCINDLVASQKGNFLSV